MVPPSKSISQTKDIEETSLEAHVRICDIRYEVLNKKHDQLDKKLEELNKKIEDIHKIVAEGKDSMTKVIVAGTGVIVALLLAAIITLIIMKY
jgi:prefoldin subunit 5